jgi:hypothetical protein
MSQGAKLKVVSTFERKIVVTDVGEMQQYFRAQTIRLIA